MESTWSSTWKIKSKLSQVKLTRVNISKLLAIQKTHLRSNHSWTLATRALCFLGVLQQCHTWCPRKSMIMTNLQTEILSLILPICQLCVSASLSLYHKGSQTRQPGRPPTFKRLQVFIFCMCSGDQNHPIHLNNLLSYFYICAPGPHLEIWPIWGPRWPLVNSWVNPYPESETLSIISFLTHLRVIFVTTEKF